jgi:hypothetical protein
VLDRGEAIAATTWSWMGVAAALSPGAIVDARHVSARRASVRVRGPASSIVIEIAGGAVIGPEFAVAVGATEHEAREGVVYAAGDGFFSTGRRIGETVRAGETVGTVAGAPVIATIDGRLRGLPARGARIHAGNRVLEIDPGKPPAPCFGVDAYGRAVADRVAQALDEARCLRSRASASVV